jgi:hypothetical protein
MNNVGPNAGKSVFPTKGVRAMNADKHASTPVDSIVRSEISRQQDTDVQETSDPYQKILDYHVGEILLTTIIFGVILLLRLHH